MLYNINGKLYLNIIVLNSASVHVNILENMGVKEVARLTQETLNSEDEFLICDSKGIEIADSPHTRRKYYKIFI